MEEINKLSDQQLINYIKDGNHRYFSVLSSRYENFILMKCKSYVKDIDTAQDLSQEIFIKLFLKLKDFRFEANFKTWLFTVVHTTCIDYLRKNKKNVRQVMTEKMVEEIADMIEDVDEVPRELSEEILNQLLDEISPEEKLILLLKYKEKATIHQIMTSLNLSESAVKMRLKRARERVNKLYSLKA